MARFTSSAGKKGVMALKQKKKSMADALNEQLMRDATGGLGNQGSDDDLYHEGGQVEDFDFGDGNGSSSGDEQPTNGKAGKGAISFAQLQQRQAPSRLRHRGPLDPSLSSGKYAATPVDVENAMDDIFGALDMGDMDQEGEEFYDGDTGEEDGYGSSGVGSIGSNTEGGEEGASDDDGSGRGPREKRRQHRRAKDLTEEEYIEWLERKRVKGKKSTRSGSGMDRLHDGYHGEEVAILEQLENLRQTQLQVVPGMGDAAATPSSSSPSSSPVGSGSKSAAATKDAVQHHILIYGQLLRLRVLLQPAVTKAITMPQYYAMPLFLNRQPKLEEEAKDGEAAATTQQRRTAIVDGFTELQMNLEGVLADLYHVATADNDEAAPRRKKQRKDSVKNDGEEGEEEKLVPTFAQIHRYHQHNVIRSANNCLEYWGSKLVQANSAKLKTIAQPLPQQIAAILSSKTRLRVKVQKNRSHLTILGHPHHVRAAASAEEKAKRAMQIAEGDIDTEIFDDADFLRELVRRGGSLAAQLERQVKDMNQTLLPSRDGARRGFHRLTKGKSVNYEPRPKLVGFVVAESFENSQRNNIVVQSLFQ